MGVFDGFGQAIKLLRTERKLGQTTLADRARVSRGLMSSYEQGKVLPKMETVERLLEAMDADLGELVEALERVRRHGMDPSVPCRRARVRRRGRPGAYLVFDLSDDLSELEEAGLPEALERFRAMTRFIQQELRRRHIAGRREDRERRRQRERAADEPGEATASEKDDPQ